MGMTAPFIEPEPKTKPSLLAVTGLTSMAAMYDLLTTMRGHNQGYEERNPIMRPLVNAGPIPAALGTAALTGAQAVMANELRKRGKSWWWVPQAATAALHVGAGLLNQTRRE